MAELLGVGREVEGRAAQMLSFPDDVPQDLAYADNFQLPFSLTLNDEELAVIRRPGVHLLAGPCRVFPGGLQVPDIQLHDSCFAALGIKLDALAGA